MPQHYSIGDSLSQRSSMHSACSSASSTVKRIDSTLALLKSVNKVDELDETESLSSSHWDTDLEEDALADEDENYSSDSMDANGETYLKICDLLGVIPVSRFEHEIGQDEIKISHRFLKETGTKAVAAVLLNDRKTLKLHVPYNEMNAKGGIYIGKVLSKNRALTELNLANNNIRRKGIIGIAEALRGNTVLRRLNLSGNGLDDRDAALLTDAVANNNTLVNLDLSYNKLSEESGVCLGAALSRNNSLLELDLCWNHIRRRGAVSISKSLRHNDSLEKLNLSWNGFDDIGTAELGESLKRNSTLRELNLSNNRVSDEGLRNIAKGLGPNETLEVLNLNHNLIFSACQGINSILEILSKNGAQALKVLCILDIKLDHDGDVLLAKVLAARKPLTIHHGCKKREAFASKKKEANPFDFLKAYLEKNRMHAFDLFKRLDPGSQFRDSLSRMEFMDGMRRLKVMNDVYLDKLVAMLDVDGDGEIDYSEFVKMS